MSDNQQIQRNETLDEFRRRTVAPPVGLPQIAESTPATFGMVMAAVESIGEAVAAEIKQLRAEVSSLKSQLVEIEAKGIFYQGVFQKAQQYKRGAMVTSDGSLFAAVRDTLPGEMPGTASDAWQLCCKKGRDARDQGR